MAVLSKLIFEFSCILFKLIKRSDKISEKDIVKSYNDLFAACERDLKKLKSLLEHQKNKDEQERLKKIQVFIWRKNGLFTNAQF